MPGRQPLFLALDAGSNSGRAVIYDLSGKELSRAKRRWRPFVPEGTAPFGRAFDPEKLWAEILSASLEALASVDPSQIVAIGVTGLRIGATFLDEAGEALYISPNRDLRALSGRTDLTSLDEEALYRSTGRFPPFLFLPGRIRWFEAEAPAIRERVQTVMGFGDYFVHRLCGARVTDRTVAADLMLYDVQEKGLSKEGLSAAGLTPSEVATLSTSGTEVGHIFPHVAQELGIGASTRVVVGGADTQMALVGAGRLRSGDTLVAGSSAPFMRICDALHRDPKGRLWTDPHAVDGSWLLESNLAEMGSIHEWMLQTFCSELSGGSHAYAAYDALAATAAPGCLAATSHLGPRAMDLRDLNTSQPAALLMQFGQLSDVGPTRPELLRAYLENSAFAVRSGRLWLDDVCARPEGPLTLTGGMARSELFAQILASVLDTEVLRSEGEASARGAFLCAAVGAGYYTDLEEASAAAGAPGCSVAPDDDWVDEYDDAFELWTEREEQLQEF